MAEDTRNDPTIRKAKETSEESLRYLMLHLLESMEGVHDRQARTVERYARIDWANNES